MKHEMKKIMPKAAKKSHITSHKGAYAKGGAVKEMAEGDEVTHANENEIKEAEGKKKGGKVVSKADGKKAAHRLDKRARGGKIMTPKSPMSGASPTKMRPGFGENTLDKSDD